MNFEKVQRKNRKAISPVLATVILIAITLIAAIAIAGFVFGLFGSFTSTAQVSVTSTALSSTTWTTGVAGTIVASNTGTGNTNINSVSMTYSGQTCSLTNVAYNPATGQVKAGASNTITLTTDAGCTTAPTSGEQFVGSLSLSNGGQVAFTGTFQ